MIFEVTVVNSSLAQKALTPISVTLLGISIDVSPQPEKASLPMLFKPLGSWIFLREVQLWKADCPILVILS